MISLRDSPIYRQKSFDESKHPRDDSGKFGEGGGGGGKSEGKLFKTRKGAGEASPEIKQAALETIKRDLVAHGRNPDDYIFGDEAIQRQAEKEPFPARVSAIARDIIRANTTKDEDVVARHDTVKGHTSLFTAGHSISSQTGSEPHAQGAGYRGRRGNVKIPHDATDEQIARLIHRANGYKLPDSLQESSGKPANNLTK